MLFGAIIYIIPRFKKPYIVSDRLLERINSKSNVGHALYCLQEKKENLVSIRHGEVRGQ